MAFSYLLEDKFWCSAMFSKKEFAFVSNLRYISKTHFMLSWVEHENSFITSGPEQEKAMSWRMMVLTIESNSQELTFYNRLMK